MSWFSLLLRSLSLFYLFCITGLFFANAQNNNEMSAEVLNTGFKSSRLVLGQTTRQLDKRELQFRVSHMFGRVSEGAGELWGLDQMQNVDLALEYGISNGMQLGVARSNDFDKTLQGTLKLILLRPSLTNHLSVYISYFGSCNIKSRSYDGQYPFQDRFEYVNQLIISKTVGRKISLLLAPVWLHTNRVPTGSHPNDLLASGVGLSFAPSSAISINVEYEYLFPSFSQSIYDVQKNALSFGLDIDTGGHVFQIFISNSSRLQASGFLTNWNNDNFFKGDLHLAFSIMRSFNF